MLKKNKRPQTGLATQGGDTTPRPKRCKRGRSLRFLRSQSGQSLVELALITPLLALLTIGIVEMGRYGYLAIVLANSARAGAAYGAQSLANSADTTGIQAAAANDFKDFGETSGLSISSSTSCGCDNGGTVTSAVCSTVANPSAGTCAAGHWVVVVSVRASAKFNSLFSYPGIPKSITVTDTSSMRVKQE